MKKLLYIIVALFLFPACQKIIEIDLPKHEIKPVVNCLFSPNRPFKVHVSLSSVPTDTTTYSIENARVVIVEKEGLATQLKSVGKGYYSKKSFRPEKGIEYTLKVKVPGFNEVVATGSVPDNGVEIKRIESKSGNKTQTEVGMGEDAIIPVQFITIDFLQNIQVPDFMGVTVINNSISYSIINDSTFVTEDKTRFNFGFLESNDPSIKNEGLDSYYEFYILLFRDLLFNNTEATVKFNVEKKTDSKFWIRFFRFSPEAFKYLKSWIIHYYTQDYDFWEVYEPQILYSNIENGYGIFAGYSEQTFVTYPDSTTTY
jgi:hypothetical protein